MERCRSLSTQLIYCININTSNSHQFFSLVAQMDAKLRFYQLGMESALQHANLKSVAKATDKD